MFSEENAFIERLFAPSLFINKDSYRILVDSRSKFSWKVKYKYSDLLIVSDKDISLRILPVLFDFYTIIEKFSESHPSFTKTFNPYIPDNDFPNIIKKMCDESAVFNVGPMASVAGAVCEYLASELARDNPYLAIENGGDIYIKSSKDITAGLFVKNRYFKDNLKIKIRKKILPCGIASSSGTLGHSLSLGKADLASAVCRSAILADSAATAACNMINTKDDIEKVINHFKDFKEIEGLVLIKDDKIGLYGNIELA
jgi:ApbE superfamily uncharacterized protein (UPF0280 family)